MPTTKSLFMEERRVPRMEWMWFGVTSLFLLMLVLAIFLGKRPFAWHDFDFLGVMWFLSGVCCYYRWREVRYGEE